MADSYTEAFLLFSSDDQLREDYLTYAGALCRRAIHGRR